MEPEDTEFTSLLIYQSTLDAIEVLGPEFPQIAFALANQLSSSMSFRPNPDDPDDDTASFDLAILVPLYRDCQSLVLKLNMLKSLTSTN